MNAQFLDLHAAADFLGPGAIEVNRYQTEITDIVRRRGRVRAANQAGAGDRASFAILRGDGDCGADGGAGVRGSAQHCGHGGGSPTRVERSVPLKALVSQINYNLFDLEVGSTAEPVRLPAGQGPGGRGGRADAHARRGAVERQRHFAEHADHVAVLRRDRADRSRRQHAQRLEPRPASWTD